MCRTLTERGWIAGFIQKEAPVRQAWLDELTDALDVRLSVLVVFDYAQARMEEIVALLEHLYHYASEGSRFRLLLLARSEEPLFGALRTQARNETLPETSIVPLPRTIASESNVSLARRAFTVFADRLGCGWLDTPPHLATRAEWQDSVLDVLALALDAVLTLQQGGTWPDHGDPLEAICDHELRGWHALVAKDQPALTGPGGPHLSDSLLLVPTLVQGLAGPELTDLLERVHASSPGRPPIYMDGVYGCLSALYPAPGNRVAPLEPDRIGEILVRRVLGRPEAERGRAAYLSALLGANMSDSPEARISAAADTIEVLARARGCTAIGRIESHPAHPALDSALREAIAGQPDILSPALAITGGWLPYAEPLAALALPFTADSGRELLESLESRLPDYPSGLSSVTVAVLDRVLAEPDGEFPEDRQLLRLRRLVRYSLRGDDIGLRRHLIWLGKLPVMVGIVERLVPDELWELFQRVVPEAPSRPQGGGRRRHGDREVLAAIVFVATSGCTWQQLPTASFGPSGATAHRRFTEWTKARVWAKLHRLVLDELGSRGQLDWSRCAVDSVNMRALKRGS